MELLEIPLNSLIHLGLKWQSLLHFPIGGRLDFFLESSDAFSASGCLATTFVSNALVEEMKCFKSSI